MNKSKYRYASLCLTMYSSTKATSKSYSTTKSYILVGYNMEIRFVSLSLPPCTLRSAFMCVSVLSLYLSFVVEHCYSSTTVRIVLIKDFTCSYKHACPASPVCTCSLVSTSCQRNVSRGKKCLHVP